MISELWSKKVLRMLTLGGKVAQSCSAIALYFRARRVRQGYQYFADAHLQERALELITEGQDRHARRHLTLNIHRHFQNKVLNGLHRTSLHDREFVLLGASCKIAECRDGVALYLLVVLEGEEVDERLKEAGFDDRRLVHGMDGHVADTGGR